MTDQEIINDRAKRIVDILCEQDTEYWMLKKIIDKAMDEIDLREWCYMKNKKTAEVLADYRK